MTFISRFYSYKIIVSMNSNVWISCYRLLMIQRSRCLVVSIKVKRKCFKESWLLLMISYWVRINGMTEGLSSNHLWGKDWLRINKLGSDCIGSLLRINLMIYLMTFWKIIQKRPSITSPSPTQKTQASSSPAMH